MVDPGVHPSVSLKRNCAMVNATVKTVLMKKQRAVSRNSSSYLNRNIVHNKIFPHFEKTVEICLQSVIHLCILQIGKLSNTVEYYFCWWLQ